MKPVLAPLLATALLLAACSSPQGAKSPQPVLSQATTSPSSAASATSSPRPALTLSAIQRLDARVGFIAGWTGTGVPLARTSDGGVSWQRISIPVSGLTALRFIDVRVGWVGGFVDRDVAGNACQTAQPCRGVVLRTQDGGRSWQTVLSIPTDDVGESIEQIQAVDGLHAWALTLAQGSCGSTPCPSELRRTTDGGRTWATLLRGQITAIRFASASRGWVALDDATGAAAEIRMTSDGGVTWRSVFHTASGGAYGLDAASIYTAWLLTRNGGYCTSSNCSSYELFRTGDGGVTWSSLGNPKATAGAACAFGHLAGPLFASTSRGWLGLNLGAGGANGGPGGLLSSQDGGKTWKCATTPKNTNLISAANPLQAWVAGEDRETQATTLFATEDGGASWHPLTLSGL